MAMSVGKKEQICMHACMTYQVKMPCLVPTSSGCSTTRGKAAPMAEVSPRMMAKPKALPTAFTPSGCKVNKQHWHIAFESEVETGSTTLRKC